MPEEWRPVDVVMEAASGPHFSGLRLDGVLSSASSSSTLADSNSPKQFFVIGVSGGTASGKTTVCDLIIQQLHDHRVVLVNQDSFYRGLTAEEAQRVHEYNFDHPDAFDSEQLVECIEKLKSGQFVQVPIYDFKSHRRCADNFRQVNASDVIILEGILVFHDPRVRNLMNMKIFVDTDDDVRLACRVRRDIVERGRDINSVLEQVVEHGLGHLPFTEKQVVTPTGSVYTGVDFCKKLCGVSIIRSGESMENALRACCKGIKIGKILIHRHGDDGKQLIYEKLPKDISERHVLLLDPVLATGNSANQAIDLLVQKGVPESRMIFLNLISAPEGIHRVCKRFPFLKIVTSEIDAALNEEFCVIPGMGEFGDRYFGTDD